MTEPVSDQHPSVPMKCRGIIRSPGGDYLAFSDAVLLSEQRTTAELGCRCDSKFMGVYGKPMKITVVGSHSVEAIEFDVRCRTEVVEDDVRGRQR